MRFAGYRRYFVSSAGVTGELIMERLCSSHEICERDIGNMREYSCKLIRRSITCVQNNAVSAARYYTMIAAIRQKLGAKNICSVTSFVVR